MRRPVFFFLVVAFVLVACTNDPFKTGDSEYSYLRSDFVEATTNGKAAFVSAVTDDAKWAIRPDTTYRAQLLYNKKAIDIEPVAIAKVYVLSVPKQTNTAKNPTDPLGSTSAWLAKTGKYVNLELALKTGKSNVQQSLGVSLETVEALANGTKKYKLRLLHNQNNVPEYYTVRTFVSIPTAFTRKGDSMELHISTYKGEVTKNFIL